jgi:hypothetical protein
MDIVRASPESVDPPSRGGRHCVFCMEEIRPGASVCRHCGSNLAPLQNLADNQATLDARLAVLEQEVAALGAATVERATAEVTSSPALLEPATPPAGTAVKWPHMADNIFLGLAALLVAHWLASTLPGSNRTIFRLVALVVALPFGFRFQSNARSGISGQVLAALAFGSLGTLAIGVLDLSLAGRTPLSPTAQDVVASVAAIALSHYAGSALAQSRQRRAERAMAGLPAQKLTTTSGSDSTSALRMHIEPARIKTTAETVKALYDAAAPLGAGAAALWAAFGHTLFLSL